jgi:tRNA dimethylallyltransferase
MVDSRVVPLIVIVGETASGKSALATKLAKKFNGEIIAADSRTVYKGMDIGTAKPSKEEMQDIPHHLLDIIEPNQAYSAAKFKVDALKLIEQITARGHLPIMVGGTGLYINSIIFDYQFADSKAERDPQNPRHLLKKSSNTASINLQQIRPNTLVIGIKIERDILEQRITRRVEHMFKNGLVEEVRSLVEQYGWGKAAMNGIGYRFVGQYIRGEISLEETKEKMIRGDLSLAKRQRTWFKRNKYIHWIDNLKTAITLVETFLAQAEHKF